MASEPLLTTRRCLALVAVLAIALAVAAIADASGDEPHPDDPIATIEPPDRTVPGPRTTTTAFALIPPLTLDRPDPAPTPISPPVTARPETVG